MDWAPTGAQTLHIVYLRKKNNAFFSLVENFPSSKCIRSLLIVLLKTEGFPPSGKRGPGRSSKCYACYHLHTCIANATIPRPTDCQTLHTMWLGDRQAAKRHKQYGLGTYGCQNVTYNLVWRPTGRQTLYTVWFEDPPATKRYTQYVLGTDRPPNVIIRMDWGPTGAQTLHRV